MTHFMINKYPYNYPYYYRDGKEICLGDMVLLDHETAYVERIWKPNTKSAITYCVPRGGIMLYELKRRSYITMEFDDYDILDPGHIEFGLAFKQRATYMFHIIFCWKYFKIFLSVILKFRFWKYMWWECVFYDTGFLFLSICELLQAFVFGPGKNVRQLINP